MAATYRWNHARRDLVAGLTVAAISVPQAMAYALIAGIEPRFGLYSAIVVTAVASVLGSSTHLINGPTNAISLVVFSALAFVDPSVRGDAFEAVFFLAIMVGVIQVLVAIFKLGDLTRYISESVLLGFMAGAGILILLGQVGNLFGLESQGTGHQHMLYRLWLTIAQGGPINVRASCLGFGTAVLVLVLRWWVRKHHLPRFDMLLALTAAAVIAAAPGWTHSSPGGPSTVQVVGDVPLGLPMPHVPRIRLEWTREMAGSALAIAVLGLVEALSVAKSIAQQTGQSLDYNRQCLAEGAANFIGGLFQCLPGSGSLTRSAINFHAGAVSRMSGVFAAGAVAFVVVALAPLRGADIPTASLAGILVVTAIGLIDVRRLRWAVGRSRFDAGLVLTTALAAVLVGVEFSILIGVILSILMFVPAPPA